MFVGSIERKMNLVRMFASSGCFVRLTNTIRRLVVWMCSFHRNQRNFRSVGMEKLFRCVKQLVPMVVERMLWLRCRQRLVLMVVERRSLFRWMRQLVGRLSLGCNLDCWRIKEITVRKNNRKTNNRQRTVVVIWFECSAAAKEVLHIWPDTSFVDVVPDGTAWAWFNEHSFTVAHEETFVCDSQTVGSV